MEPGTGSAENTSILVRMGTLALHVGAWVTNRTRSNGRPQQRLAGERLRTAGVAGGRACTAHQ
jgi:hypothetical protein